MSINAVAAGALTHCLTDLGLTQLNARVSPLLISLGHTFWDLATWQYPALAPLYPSLGAALARGETVIMRQSESKRAQISIRVQLLLSAFVLGLSLNDSLAPG
jgi:hypothetical protein